MKFRTSSSAAALLAVLYALTASAQVRSDRTSDRTETDERRVPETFGDRYRVYEPGAGYGGDLYLNDQYLLGPNSTRQVEPNRTRLTPGAAGGLAQAPAERRPTRQLRGELVEVREVAATDDQPATVELVVGTPEGEQAVNLGDADYVRQNLPGADAGDRVLVISEQADDESFQPRQVVLRAGSYQVPDYRYGVRFEGELIAIEEAAGAAEPTARARVRLSDEQTIALNLGPMEALQQRGQMPKAGNPVSVRAFVRIVGQTPELVIREVSIAGRVVGPEPAASSAPPADAQNDAAPPAREAR